MTYRDEMIKTVAEMYEECCFNREIAQVTGIKDSQVPFAIAYAVEKGYTVSQSPQIDKLIDMKRKVASLLNAGRTRHEVCIELDILPAKISDYVKSLQAEGKAKHINRSRVVSAGAFITVPSTLAPGETIECTGKVSRSCVYGTLNPNDSLCRYMFITGHCRSLGPGGCDYKACTKYSKVSRSNPRIRIVE